MTGAPQDAPSRVGRYSLLRTLGDGGMSTVYRAYDPELDRQVALKLLNHDAPGDRGPARLIREARAMAKVCHPNVAAVYDVGLVDRQVFIAMELLEGPTLEHWAFETVRPWTEVLRMYLQAGRGLAAAHEAGLAHRDFKPDNVMIGADGRPRVLDFGLARPAAELHVGQGKRGALDSMTMAEAELEPGAALDEHEGEHAELLLDDDEDLPEDEGEDTLGDDEFDFRAEVTRHGMVTGTPAYMAPEQHLGAAGGPAADQFAFCVSLWEALYRQRPYGGESFFAIADAIIEGRRREPPRRSRVPQWLRHQLERGLAVEPKRRHPSMRSLLASLVFSFRVMHAS